MATRASLQLARLKAHASSDKWKLIGTNTLYAQEHGLQEHAAIQWRPLDSTGANPEDDVYLPEWYQTCYWHYPFCLPLFDFKRLYRYLVGSYSVPYRPVPPALSPPSPPPSAYVSDPEDEPEDEVQPDEDPYYWSHGRLEVWPIQESGPDGRQYWWLSHVENHEEGVYNGRLYYCCDRYFNDFPPSWGDFHITSLGALHEVTDSQGGPHSPQSLRQRRLWRWSHPTVTGQIDQDEWSEIEWYWFLSFAEDSDPEAWMSQILSLPPTPVAEGVEPDSPPPQTYTTWGWY